MDFKTFKTKTQTQAAIVWSDSIILDNQTTISLTHQFTSEPDLCLLESADPTHAQYGDSYLAMTAYCHVVIDRNNQLYSIKNGVHTPLNCSIYDHIKYLTQTYALPHDVGSFRGGIIGYMNYECVALSESESIPVHPSYTDIARFMIPRTVIKINNRTHCVTINQWVFDDDWSGSVHAIEDCYTALKNRLTAIKTKLQQVPDTPLVAITPRRATSSAAPSADTLTDNRSKSDFMQAVDSAKAYIAAGDIFQIQVSRRRSMPLTTDPFTFYRLLRYTNPSPFMYYARFGDTCLLGSSPELLVGVESNTVTIRPIAGTRKRHSRHRSDEMIIQELASNEKERAEHVMLVDLARHDLRQCCESGSVQVNTLMSIETYQHVVHMVSDVTGQLKSGYHAVDAFRYGFPAGTVTGAPKIRAMELIHTLEPDARGAYSGGVVFFDFCNQVKSTLIIRSIFIHNNIASTQAAAGIVADSIPEQEWQETINKMQSSIDSMRYSL